MKYNYRCGSDGCRKRTVLKHKVHHATCKHCGGNLNYDPEVKRRHKKEVCYCGGPDFNPHRKGWAPWCLHSERLPTDEEYIDRYGEFDRYAEAH